MHIHAPKRTHIQKLTHIHRHTLTLHTHIHIRETLWLHTDNSETYTPVRTGVSVCSNFVAILVSHILQSSYCRRTSMPRKNCWIVTTSRVRIPKHTSIAGVITPRGFTPRVPGLPIRDCARGCNNCVHTRAQMSARDVTKNTFFERLY